MGRQLPTVCEHGRVVDWGDFGYGRPVETCDICAPTVYELRNGDKKERE